MAAGDGMKRARRKAMIAAVVCGCTLAALAAAAADSESASGRDPFQMVTPVRPDADPPQAVEQFRIAGYVATRERRLALLVEDATGVGYIVAEGSVLPTAALRVQALQADAVLLADLYRDESTWLWNGEGEGECLTDPCR